MSNRDTQFLGFAKLLMRDLDAVSTTTYASLDKAKEAYELAIVRRAYDFAKHIMNVTTEEMACVMFIDDAVEKIPDMTEWPKEQE